MGIATMTGHAGLVRRLRELYWARWDSTPLSVLFAHLTEAADAIESLTVKPADPTDPNIPDLVEDSPQPPLD